MVCGLLPEIRDSHFLLSGKCQFCLKTAVHFGNFKGMPYICKLIQTMGIKSKRQTTARMLLAVFVPMLLLTSLHTHHEARTTGDDCYQCAHHQPHSGHLSAVQSVVHDCLLCQLASVPYISATVLLLVLPVRAVVRTLSRDDADFSRCVYGTKQSRAPPFV